MAEEEKRRDLEKEVKSQYPNRMPSSPTRLSSSGTVVGSWEVYIQNDFKSSRTLCCLHRPGKGRKSIYNEEGSMVAADDVIFPTMTDGTTILTHLLGETVWHHSSTLHTWSLLESTVLSPSNLPT